MSTNDSHGVTCPACAGLIRSDASCRCPPNAFPLIGAVLGANVRLDGILGAGGMGRVYEGFDLSLHRRVAVKVLARSAPAEVKERFAREGRSLASLEHPNVVQVHAAGVSPEGTPFLVMKLLAAKTLNQWSGGAAVAADRVLPVLRQLSSAIDALHSSGIIHRDIKPANVMVDDSGKVTLVDLGVALGQGSRLTKVGLVVGTVDFMSPEQLAGEPLSSATDLYALGLLTSELLVGPRRLSLHEREQELAARFSGHAPRIDTLNPAVTPEVALVVHRALSPAAKDRFKSAAAFVKAFEEALGGASVKTLEHPALQPPVSSRVPLIIVAGVAAAAIGLTSVWALSRERQRAEVAIVPPVESEVVAQMDSASLRALGTQLRALPAVTEATQARVAFGRGLVLAVAAARLTDDLTRRRSELLGRDEQRLSDDQRRELGQLANRHTALLKRLALALGELGTVAQALESAPPDAGARRVVGHWHAIEGRTGPSDDDVASALLLLERPLTPTSIAAQLRLGEAFAARVDRGGLDTVLAVHLEFRTRGVGGLLWLLARSPPSPDVEEWRATLRPVPQGPWDPVADLHEDPYGDSTAAGGAFVDNTAVLDGVSVRDFLLQVREGQSIESMLERMSRESGSNAEKRELFETKLSRVKKQCASANTKRKLLDCDDNVRRLHVQFYRVID